MKVFLVSFALAQALVLGARSEQDTSQVDKVIENALKYITSDKNGTGVKGSGLAGLNCSQSTSAFEGLAILASGTTLKEGKYQNVLEKLVESNKRTASLILGRMRKSFGGQLRPVNRDDRHAIPYVALFLAHIYQMAKSDDLKQLLEKLRDAMVHEQGKEGGWSYPGTGGTMTFMANNYLLSLLTLHHVGINTPDDTFAKSVKFYTSGRMQVDDGSFKYFAGSGNCGKAAVGRTADALFIMKLLGASGTEAFKKGRAFVEKNMDKVDIGHHGAAYPVLFGGLGCFGMGDDLWKSFNSYYKEKLVKAHREDGSIYFTPRQETFWPIDDDAGGPAYTTTLFAIVLQLQKGHLIFDKIKPLEIKK